MHILLSRTDSIGDVVLTLPLTGLLKEKYPDCKITFLGRTYTRAIIELSRHVDRFENWDDYEKLPAHEHTKKIRALQANWIVHVFPNPKIAAVAKKAGIKNRVGTSYRTFHWFTCNRLISFSRRKSDLHEAQLNCKLLAPLDIEVPELQTLGSCYGFKNPTEGREKILPLLDIKKKNIVLHPKSKGSAREWGTGNFDRLIELLPADKFRIFISGTQEEAGQMKELLEKHKEKIVDITGRFTLPEFITFLSLSDGIVAASTGPLHIAAALGRTAIGIYPPIKPMHPGRWAPIGENVQVLIKEGTCNDCHKSRDCHCMREITPEQVKKALLNSFPEEEQ